MFENACQEVFKQIRRSTTDELTIVITDDEQIRKLNKQYRKIDAVTDVLSFPSDEIDPETGIAYLGDVVISYPQTIKQATIACHSVETELQLLTIHGVLHLFGFDHSNDEEKTRMWEVQNAALQKLGIFNINIVDVED